MKECFLPVITFLTILKFDFSFCFTDIYLFAEVKCPLSEQMM